MKTISEMSKLLYIFTTRIDDSIAVWELLVVLTTGVSDQNI